MIHYSILGAYSEGGETYFSMMRLSRYEKHSFTTVDEYIHLLDEYNHSLAR